MFELYLKWPKQNTLVYLDENVFACGQQYEGASQEKENVSPSFYPQSALDDLGVL